MGFLLGQIAPLDASSVTALHVVVTILFLQVHLFIYKPLRLIAGHALQHDSGVQQHHGRAHVRRTSLEMISTSMHSFMCIVMMSSLTRCRYLLTPVNTKLQCADANFANGGDTVALFFWMHCADIP